ncbi:MAG: hypothetical protein LQ346_001118 [Caloplaca aetnensis]|nr:MAG: hypothetical protein LQ346_001118 [Caloplaca aetnensis]
MDKLKDLAGKASGSSSGGGEQKPAAGGQEDYLDKGLAAGEKQFGIPENKGMNEKITDQGRDMFEKQTGKDIPDKVSN